MRTIWINSLFTRTQPLVRLGAEPTYDIPVAHSSIANYDPQKRKVVLTWQYHFTCRIGCTTGAASPLFDVAYRSSLGFQFLFQYLAPGDRTVTEFLFIILGNYHTKMRSLAQWIGIWKPLAIEYRG